MICHESHIDVLRRLAPEELDRELRHEITDALQELVAGIDHAALDRGKSFRSCVIEDFKISQSKCEDDRCIVLLYYTASAQRHGAGSGGNEMIHGSAILSIDSAGQVTCKGVTFNEEPQTVAPDVGVGD